jgi:predicted deacylase
MNNRIKCGGLFAAVIVMLSANLESSVGAGAQEPGGTIGEGTASVTPYYIVDSGTTGPVVVVVGGIHGNEPAGAQAADLVRQWPVTRGRLVVIPKANTLALAANKRNTPGIAPAQGNLNRNFPKAEGRHSATGELAKALWKFVEEQKPDWLVDLHESTDFGQINTKNVGSSIIIFSTPATREAVEPMLAAVNETISEPKKKFIRRIPPADGSLARAAGERLRANTMILETTRKDQDVSVRVRQHEIMVYTLLRHLKMLGDKFSI